MPEQLVCNRCNEPLSTDLLSFIWDKELLCQACHTLAMETEKSLSQVLSAAILAMHTLEKWLKIPQSEQQWSQAAIARRADVDPGNLNRILSGRRHAATAETLRRIGEAIKVDPVRLAGSSGEKRDIPTE